MPKKLLDEISLRKLLVSQLYFLLAFNAAYLLGQINIDGH